MGPAGGRRALPGRDRTCTRMSPGAVRGPTSRSPASACIGGGEAGNEVGARRIDDVGCAQSNGAASGIAGEQERSTLVALAPSASADDQSAGLRPHRRGAGRHGACLSRQLRQDIRACCGRHVGLHRGQPTPTATARPTVLAALPPAAGQRRLAPTAATGRRSATGSQRRAHGGHKQPGRRRRAAPPMSPSRRDRHHRHGTRNRAGRPLR
jgi:hypothetical protein